LTARILSNRRVEARQIVDRAEAQVDHSRRMPSALRLLATRSISSEWSIPQT